MVFSDEVLKENGLTKVEHDVGGGFIIETHGGSHMYLTYDLLSKLFRASDIDPSDFV